MDILKHVKTTGELRWEREEPLLELLHGQFILLYPERPGLVRGESHCQQAH